MFNVNSLFFLIGIKKKKTKKPTQHRDFPGGSVADSVFPMQGAGI